MTSTKVETSTKEVAALLGGEMVFRRRIFEQHEMREALRKGLPYPALESLASVMELKATELTKIIGIAPRTLARRKEAKGVFNAVESDRLYRLARIVSLAIEVLNSKEKAREWLMRPNRALGGEAPLSLLDTDIGAKQVEEVLGRIAYGVYS
ncbi:MAG: antitoxin Xre/MbcA/ParS toxin-binding domain-containing protein [Ignavibacteriales bacterium]